MSLPEVAWRLKQFAQIRLESSGFGLAKYQGTTERSCGKAWLINFPRNFNPLPYKTEADRILSGQFDVLAMHDVRLGFPPQWNKDPKTGIIAPADFGMTINYRDENVTGDIKYIWEINRHLELVIIAQAYHLTKKKIYSEAIRILLNSWLDQCPYAIGPNWLSSLEISVRLVNWSFVWHLMGGEKSLLFTGQTGQAFKKRWLCSIYEHCHFISTHFSRYSSANNHFFGENMGLFIGSITWPLWKESATWLETSRLSLEKEAISQISSDGVNLEQAIWYQHEVADMMLLCGIIGKSNGVHFSVKFWKRLEAALDFFASAMDVSGNMPMIGDSDDGVIVRFSPSPDFNVYRSLLATGAVLFNRGDFKVKAGVFDDKSRWLLGDAAEKTFDSLNSSHKSLSPNRTFQKGGYYIMGDGFEAAKEIKLVVDAGPVGYLSIAAHGHADALAFCLSAGGKEILIDPGTYVYGFSKQWRDYFRGTSAHNTVRIDGQDQSQSGGDFLWLYKAHCKCEQWYSNPSEDFICASHNGYGRLDDPVKHTRSIRLLKNEYRIEVCDKIECKLSHRVERFWHFSEHCEVYEKSNTLIVVNGGLELQIRVSDKSKTKVIYAYNESPYGWISRSFDKKLRSVTAIFTNEIKGITNLKTLMTLKWPQN